MQGNQQKTNMPGTLIESSKTRIEKVKLHLLPREDNDEENQQEDNREDGE